MANAFPDLKLLTTQLHEAFPKKYYESYNKKLPIILHKLLHNKQKVILALKAHSIHRQKRFNQLLFTDATPDRIAFTGIGDWSEAIHQDQTPNELTAVSKALAAVNPNTKLFICSDSSTVV